MPFLIPQLVIFWKFLCDQPFNHFFLRVFGLYVAFVSSTNRVVFVLIWIWNSDWLIPLFHFYLNNFSFIYNQSINKPSHLKLNNPFVSLPTYRSLGPMIHAITFRPDLHLPISIYLEIWSILYSIFVVADFHIRPLEKLEHSTVRSLAIFGYLTLLQAPFFLVLVPRNKSSTGDFRYFH